MDYSSIKTGLEGFVERYDSQTFIGSYRETNRSSLLNDGLSTRANSLWKMAEYVVAKYDNTNNPIDSYIKGWKQLASGANNQYLLIEEAKDVWAVYNAQGERLGGEDYIRVLFEKKKKQRTFSNHTESGNAKDFPKPIQQIYYGAPGTGKSHEINRLTEGKNVIRTTFHPDTDYSTFVGCYKPHMEETYMTTVIGETLKIVRDEEGNPKPEKRIVYKYSSQAFLQAYINAWQQPEQEQYLVIEEINRGNCAQIFGDIFQLLDRNEEGLSSYPIKTDTDAENELRAVFTEKWNLADEKAQEIDNLYRKHYPNGITKDIKNGSLLLLPSNLYIWATMNTSDQSLFPIDSAFKRRWDWKYIKISEGRDADTKELLNWVVKFNFMDEDKQFTFECSWWEFIKAINEKIASATSSDDKKLGYFFCKPKIKDSKEIDSETFVGKVVFYLWNDVFKDEENLIFKVTEGKANPSFDAFYIENESGKTIVDTTALRTFMHNVFGEQSDLYTEIEVKAE